MAGTFGASGEGVLGIGILVVAGTGTGTGTGRTVSGSGGSAGTGGVTRPVRMVVSWRMAVMWLVLRGTCGDTGLGLFNAWRMSFMPPRMISLDEAKGRSTLVGSYVMVLQIRSERVSQIQHV